MPLPGLSNKLGSVGSTPTVSIPKVMSPFIFPGGSVHSDAVQRLKQVVRGLGFKTRPVVSRI